MLLKTGPCFTAELENNCPTIVACVAALPVGAPAVAGDLVLGPDNQYHALPAAAAPALSIAGNQLTIVGGNTVTLPDNDTQDLSISGNVISLTNGGSVTLPTTAAPVPQVLSIAGNTVSLSGGGGSVVVPDTQDLSLVGNVLSLTNGGSVTLPAASQDPYATAAQTITGTALSLIVNPADLYTRENMPAQTGLSNNLANIPAPAANLSPWGVNLLGETLHYAPGIGWQIVGKYWHAACDILSSAPLALAANVAGSGCPVVIPRNGLYMITASVKTVAPVTAVQTGGIMINGALKAFDNTGGMGVQTGTNVTHAPLDNNSSAAWTERLTAGDVVSMFGLILSSGGEMTGELRISSLGQ